MPPFADKSSLQAAAQEYNNDVTAATYKYGPIASWDVSAITDMSHLFNYASDFNADISSWDTSSVTDMEGMFSVRPARAPLASDLPPLAPSLHAACAAATHLPTPSQPPPWPRMPRPFPRPPFPLGRARRRSTRG